MAEDVLSANEPEVEFALRTGTGAALIDRVGAVTEVKVVEHEEQRVLATLRRDGGWLRE